jgi:hypothetical protein
MTSLTVLATFGKSIPGQNNFIRMKFTYIYLKSIKNAFVYHGINTLLDINHMESGLNKQT